MLKRKLSAYFSMRKYMLLIVFTALCAGMVAGAFGVMHNPTQLSAEVNMLSGKELVVSSFSESVKFLGWLVLWGVNLFGFPVILYLIYTKGATLSAALCILASDNTSGTLTLLSALPYFACTVASVMILSQGALHSSFGLFKSIWNKRGNGISEELPVLIAEFVPAMLLALLGGVCETIFKANIA